ncbi:MAG: AI-2E family transporter YdiK [Betaproteobacteria bacterium]|nr:AI-2E family transporter YdiK [Betaproteobacteria bacterium]
MREGRTELARTTLVVLFIGTLILASVWILRPFIAPMIWAAMIVVATWPLMRRVQARLWQRRALAVLVMTLGLLLVFVVPLTLAITTIVGHADEIIAWARGLATLQLPPPPEWLRALPLFGESLAHLWQTLAAEGVRDLALRAEPYVGQIAKWFLSEVGSFGIVFMQFLLTVALAAVLYADGESWAGWLRRFGARLAPQRGEEAVALAGQAIRGVALGVVVTALLQSLLGGIGLALAGIPFATMLTALMFMLCIAQVGVVPVLVPAVIWLYWSGSDGWGTFLLLWTVFAGTIDNVIRPFLIKQGADLPLLLIFAGVIGGLFAFGLVGIFVGPVVLAVGYTLIDAWVREKPAAAGRDDPR